MAVGCSSMLRKAGFIIGFYASPIKIYFKCRLG
jgi:hypothetical protein